MPAATLMEVEPPELLEALASGVGVLPGLEPALPLSAAMPSPTERWLLVWACTLLPLLGLSGAPPELALPSDSVSEEPRAAKPTLPPGVRLRAVVEKTLWGPMVRPRLMPRARLPLLLLLPRAALLTLAVWLALAAKLRDRLMAAGAAVPSEAVVVRLEMVMATTGTMETLELLAPFSALVSVASLVVALSVMSRAPLRVVALPTPASVVMLTMLKPRLAPMPKLGPETPPERPLA